MLNKIAMVDVYNGANLINDAEIIRLPQLVKYYENQGFKKMYKVTQQEYSKLGFKLSSIWLQSTF